MPRMYTRGDFDYVLIGDKGLPEDQQAVFELATLNPETDAKLQDDIIATTTALDPTKQDMSVKNQMATVSLQILKHGLRGWRNFYKNGKEVVFKSKGAPLCSPENIAELHPRDRLELSDAVTEGNSIDEQTAKNSPSEPGSETES